MNLLERKNFILRMLDEKPSVDVAELSAVLGVSEVTVRKVLNEMDTQHLLKRTRGGAVSLSLAASERPESEKEQTNIREKRAIAARAYAMIEERDGIFLDAGSTSMELAKLIRDGEKRRIVVMTHAINIAYILVGAPDIEFVMVGGSVRHNIMSCVGAMAESTISDLYFDKLFLGCNALSLEHGVTTPNVNEAHVKKVMLSSAHKSILLCDSSKFGQVSMCRICPVSALDVVITDSNLDPADRELLAQNCGTLEIAEL